MRPKSSIVQLANIQIKTLQKARALAKALEIIDAECAVHQLRLGLENVFLCSWVDLEKLNKTPMERFLRDSLKKTID